MFRKLISAALIAVSLTGAADAGPIGDLTCHVKNRKGVDVNYSFRNNSENTDDTIGGTMVETRYEANGKTTVSEVGRCPIWMYHSGSDWMMNCAGLRAGCWN